MIFVEALGINVVRVSGLDTRRVSVVRWRRALERMGADLQARIYAMYRIERNAQGQRFRPNSAKWNARKAKKGWAPERGQMLRRIINTLRLEPMFTVSAIVNGQAVITFDEKRLIARWGHAYYYAVNKVHGKRILQVNAAWLGQASRWIKTLDAEATAEEARRIQRIGFSPDTFSIPAPGRRVTTLAATAWKAARDTAARLRRL